MCYNSEIASELTMQPILRFDFDMAIIFSDILVILDALGFHVDFVEKIGPIIKKTQSFFSINTNFFVTNQKLLSIYLAIKKVRASLSKEKALLGFIGAPWTLACYACEGKSSKDFHETKKFAYKNQEEFEHLINILTDACFIHASAQIEAGADAIQIFDSWSGVLNEEDYHKWVLKPLTALSQLIRSKHPNTSIIWFPKGSFGHYANFLKEKKNNTQNIIDCMGVDYCTSLSSVCDILDSEIIIQGNLDPSVLLGKDFSFIEERVINILKTFKSYNRSCIFNLGHGILPETSIDNVHCVINCVRKFSDELHN
jgi:uroporphyrinogen decarboxylase